MTINQFLFANNANSTLAGAITNTATTANLASGTGSLFPPPGTNQAFVATFTSASNPAIQEIVYVTAISGDTVTLVRGQEGTTALAWNANDLFQMLCTAGTQKNFVQLGSNLTPNSTGNVSVSIGPGYSGSLTLGFTAPHNGSLLVMGILNLTTAAGGLITNHITNSYNGINFSQSSELSSTVLFTTSFPAGESVTVTQTITAASGSWSAVSGTYSIAYIWVPSL